jgi:hypothetical protein
MGTAIKLNENDDTLFARARVRDGSVIFEIYMPVLCSRAVGQSIEGEYRCYSLVEEDELHPFRQWIGPGTFLVKTYIFASTRREIIDADV